jgi:ATP-dependent Clp protease ATP-binding subunit ClpB
MQELRRHFRPEFLNRLDDIIFYKPLALKDIEKIVDIQLGALRRLLAERKITLDLTESAKKALAKEGFDPIYGARPLKRVIQKRVQDHLARELLEGKIKDGDDVKVSVDKNGEYEFKNVT